MTEPFAEWIGRESEAEDIVSPRLVASFEAIFGEHLAPVGAGEAPLGLHWCLCPAIAPMEALGGDGHPALNRDLPPIPQPRRMWAGGSLETLAPLREGDTVQRRSRIASITRKEGRSGELWFVGVDHDYWSPRGLAIRERHDIVYREAGRPGGGAVGADAAPKPSAPGDWVVETPPTLLFRYSAITFNGHRIHYDLPYAREVEHYPGLVVHGPIQATLLFNRAAVEAGAAPRHLSYRGVSPAFAGSPIRVRAVGPGAFQTENVAGQLHMQASVESPAEGR